MSVIPVTLRDSFFTDNFFQSSWEDFDQIKRNMLEQSKDFWEKAEKNRMEMRKNMESSMKSSISSNVSSSNNKNMSNMMSNSSSMSTSSSEKGSCIKDMMNKDMLSLGSDDFFAPWFFPRRWMVPTSVSNGNNIDANSEISKITSSSKDLISSANSNMKLFPSDFFSSMNQDEQVIRTKEDDSKFEVSLDTHEYKPEEVKVNIVGNVISVEAKHEEKSENKFVSRQFSRKYTLPENCIAGSVSSNLSSDGILMITAHKKEVKKVEATGPRPVPITMRH